MRPLPLSLIAEWTRGTVDFENAAAEVRRVTTDSRTLQAGDLFVALKGEIHDGHDHVAEAAAKGAVAAMVRRGFEAPGAKIALIQVDDTLAGLQDMARGYRRSLNVRVLGVTGSSGKTSAKEFAAAVLSRRFPTHKTEGNFNNHIGLPLTLLAAEPHHEWIVAEMGMNHAGEIQALCGIAQPDAGIITNIGWAHIEFFKDQAGIAHEKGSLARALGPEGLAVLNGDDPLLRGMAGSLRARTVFAGRDGSCGYRFHDARWTGERMEFSVETPHGGAVMNLGVPGWHMVQNAMLAVALGLELGIGMEDVKAGLAGTRLPKSRVALEPFNGGWLLDDSYNANPDSMVASFRTLGLMPGEGRKVALLGAMGELGGFSEVLHQFVGRTAREESMDLLFVTGEPGRAVVSAARQAGMDAGSARWFESAESLFDAYHAQALPGDRIVVKGSRSQRMERVAGWLKKGALSCSTT
jgi:UDP-N-acetylmuramoyl-tripeptide--D-alanyl-D-alanine ligase